MSRQHLVTLSVGPDVECRRSEKTIIRFGPLAFIQINSVMVSWLCGHCVTSACIHGNEAAGEGPNTLRCVHKAVRHNQGVWRTLPLLDRRRGELFTQVFYCDES